MKGWWYSATTEQKLAQVKAGIELGMTSAQVAMNCGCAYDYKDEKFGTLVRHFAERHGLHFSYKFTEKMRQGVTADQEQRKVYGDWPSAPRDLVSGLKEWGWQ